MGPDGRGVDGESTKKCGLLKSVGNHQRCVGSDMIKAGLCLLFFPGRHDPQTIIAAPPT